MQNFPVTRDLVLIGGGHAHALVLRMWGMKPLAGVRVTVINPGPTAPYSGMLPGHIAGHYTQPDLEIDLVQLAQFAGARIIVGSAVGIDPKTRRITVPGRPEVAYDVASIDVGITAQMPMIKGFLEHAIGAKPLDVYAKAWRDFLADVTAGRKDPRVAVIGGGVAGVELSLAMSHALRTAGHLGRVTIVEAGADISGVSAATRALLHREMIAQGVDLKSNLTVREITKGACHLSDGSVLAADMIVGAAGAIPHYWVSRIAVPQTNGYINVEETLLVQGFSDLFAVGDCAHMMAHPRPKAGVFAVRAAPVLYENLKAALSTGPLTPFVPQRRYLKLISLGGQRAAAEKWERVVHGRALWRWKNAIDQKFMNQVKSGFQKQIFKTLSPEVFIKNDFTNVDYFLIEGNPEKHDQPGGNNKTWNWSEFSNPKKLPFILSGGLNESNVLDAINLTGADFVDINSGVEEKKGEKNLSLIDRLVSSLKSNEKL